jgi:UPF0176 protein
MENKIVISAFYHFCNLNNYRDIRDSLLDFCNSLELKGTILLAYEGINSTISGSTESIEALHKYLRNISGLESLETKESYSDNQPFKRMKVLLKKEIVTLKSANLDLDKRGEYIKALNWDDFITRPDVITIDTRNDYEVEIGTFKGAIDPKTKTFSEFKEWAQDNLHNKDTPIAMFCTGGIRCEKSTAYLKNQGFSNVYHLQGGILKYFEETKNQNNMWQGDCFVFDQRRAVDDKLNPVRDNNEL